MLPLRATGIVAALALSLALAVPASGASSHPENDPVTPGAKRYLLKAGPFKLRPGQNTIELDGRVPQPERSGYIVRMRPDLVYPNGRRPPVDVVHLHHGVWVNGSRPGVSTGIGAELFFATGEEKTIFTMPRGYGLPYKRTDRWILNHMLHNLTASPYTVYVVLEVDLIPAGSSAAKRTRPVRPVWMDVERDKTYPVFDVHRGSGENGRFTYPNDQPGGAYRGRDRKNVWTVDRDGLLVATGGHLHPGGLHTDLWLRRDGEPEVSHLFRSKARYYEPAGPVSWDVSMTVSKPDWRVKVRKGDRLSVSATYDSSRASWYESMGIMIAYMADAGPGKDPFAEKVDTAGILSHGRLPENRDSGGRSTGLPDPGALAAMGPAEQVAVRDFLYEPGDLSLGGGVPIVRAGDSLRFVNQEGDPTLMHSVTACKEPCNRSGGIRYPLANGPVDFDSGNIGFGPPGFTAAANRAEWDTPNDLPGGTYTYFCRQHPFMRGAFRVVE